MARRLKVFRTHIGFHDVIAAAPSMKAAAELWGTHTRVFAQGFAEETQDPDAVTAALAQPGIVLKRPFGTKGTFKSDPDPVTAPKPTERQKKNAAAAEQARKRDEAAKARAKDKAARKARLDAKNELADIEEEERNLRERRQALRKKFHLRAV